MTCTTRKSTLSLQFYDIFATGDAFARSRLLLFSINEISSPPPSLSIKCLEKVSPQGGLLEDLWYVSGLSVYIFVALCVRMSVPGANKVEGTIIDA